MGVGSLHDRLELECELAWVLDASGAPLLGKQAEPRGHRPANGVVDRTRAIVELGRRRSPKAAAGEHLALKMVEIEAA